MVGYVVKDPETGELLNQLRDWGPRMDPDHWQRMPTVFERAEGLRGDVISHPKYLDSGFSRAVLRGAEFISATSIAERLDRAVERATEPGISYVYSAELDIAAHASGWESPLWTARLEELDAALANMLRRLPPRTGVLVTADHGVLDVPEHRHILFDQLAPELMREVSAVAGDPRVVSLHLGSGATADDRLRAAAAWQDALGDQVWSFSREQAIEQGLFGAVDPAVVPRIGEVLIAARKAIALYDSRTASPRARAMIGQHGSLTDEEVRVPLLRFGAFGG